MQKFTHLHLHTDASLLDGIASVEDHVQFAKKNGLKSLGISDHGNLNNALKFYNACVKEEIKPIIGCEFYQSELIGQVNSEGKRLDRKKNHILILVKNEAGWKNILKLNKISYDNFYYKPTISFKDIFKNKEGLIISNACLGGTIPQMILNKRFEEVDNLILKFQEELGEDFYLEVQMNNIEEQKTVNEYLILAGQKYGIKVILTGDVHYIKKEDYKYQKLLRAIQQKKKVEQLHNYIDVQENYFKLPEDYYRINEEYKYGYKKEKIDSWLENTMEISDKVNFVFPKEKHYPSFQITKELISKYSIDTSLNDKNKKTKLLTKLCINGLKEKFKNGVADESKKDEYKKRLKKELEVIFKLDYVDYFLVVWDLINYADSVGIERGVSRGSVGGSLVAFLTKITNLDPVRWNTILERFLSVERADMPDIDLDFEKKRREEVFEYLKNKYPNYLAIGTKQTFGIKNLMRDYARVMSFSKEEISVIDKISKKMGIRQTPEDLKKEFESIENIKEVLPNYKKMFTFVKTMFGKTRSFGAHASGIAITDIPIVNIMPVNKTSSVFVTGFEEGAQGRELSELGVTKFDILGLKTLGVISGAKKLIKQDYGDDVLKKINQDFERFDWIDQDFLLWELKKDNTGIFQFESESFYKFLTLMKPKSFKHLIDANALYRPDALMSGEAFHYINRKNKKEKTPVKLKQNEILANIVKDTQYSFVFQEQIMFLLHDYFDFTMAEANVARKYISKKKKKALSKMLDEKIGSNPKLQEKNQEEIKSLLDMLYKYGGYSFNYSHSVGYTLTSLECLYLKNKYTKEFLTSNINENVGENDDKVSQTLQSLKKYNIQLLPVDINKSDYLFTVEGDNIRAGFSIIKGFSYRAYKEIERERNSKQNKSFKNLYDFFHSDFNWGKLNKRIVEFLIKLGAFDSIEENQKKIVEILKNKDKITKRKSEEETLSLFSKEVIEKQMNGKSSVINKILEKQINDYTFDTKIANEYKIIGFNYWQDVFKEKRTMINDFRMSGALIPLKEKKEGLFTIVYVNNVKKRKSKSGKDLYFLSVIDFDGNKEDLLIFKTLYEQTQPKKGMILRISFRKYFDSFRKINSFNILNIKEI